MAGVPRIWVVFHSHGSCPTQFAVDLTRALRYSGTIIPAVLHEQSCYVDTARNKLVRQFLAQPEGTHMMMVDVDISFSSDAFLKTFDLMQALGADLVYGNYCLGNGSNSIFGPPDNISKEAAVKVGLQPNKVYTDIATGGTGWLLCTKDLLLRMQKECPGPWHWFARDPTSDGKDLRGEDITFGLRAYALNPRPKIVATTSIVLRHMKNIGQFPDFMLKEAGEAGFAGMSAPNPYENDPKRYLCVGNSVVDKQSLTPEQLEQVEADVARFRINGKEVEKLDASRARERAEESGEEKGPEGEASRSIHLRDAPENGLETEERTRLDGDGKIEEGEKGDLSG